MSPYVEISGFSRIIFAGWHDIVAGQCKCRVNWPADHNNNEELVSHYGAKMTLKCNKNAFYVIKTANFLGTSAKVSQNLCRPFYILKNIRRPKSEISTYGVSQRLKLKTKKIK